MDINTISNHLYNDSVPQAINYVKTIKDEEALFVYAYNYNWDNGFDVPTEILNNESCTLSIALLIFSLSDGFLFLEDKETECGTKAWSNFINDLYKRIASKSFPAGKAAYDPQLTKVQEYKLKKVINDNELLFMTPIDGTNCYQKI